MQRNALLLPSALFLMGAMFIYNGTQPADAISETITSRAIQMTRVRLSFTDVKNAPTVADPGGVCNGLAKRVVIQSMPAGGQINTIVTTVRAAFAGTGFSQIGAVAVVAEKNNVVVSNGDIGTPKTDLTDVDEIENTSAVTGEIAFYDESDPWQAVAYICGRNDVAEPVSISNLTAGSVDFYITETR